MIISSIIIKAVIGIALGLVLLQQADRAIWYYTCLFKSSSLTSDQNRVYTSTKNPFVTIPKIGSSLVLLIGFGLLVFDVNNFLGKVLGIVGSILFTVASTTSALSAFKRAAKNLE